MPYLWRTIDSIVKQEYREFDLCIIDDASSQPGQLELIDWARRRYGFEVVANSFNLGCLANTKLGIERLDPNPDDVIVTVDGDDWLAHSKVLSRVAQRYETGRWDLTYGQYATYPFYRTGHCRPVRTRSFRNRPFVFSHLRTFKHFLWKGIDQSTFVDPQGAIYRHATDLAFMYPMLEMAGDRFTFVDEILYIYNRETPYNEDKVAKAKQDAVASHFKSLRPHDAGWK